MKPMQTGYPEYTGLTGRCGMALGRAGGHDPVGREQPLGHGEVREASEHVDVDDGRELVLWSGEEGGESGDRPELVAISFTPTEG